MGKIASAAAPAVALVNPAAGGALGVAGAGMVRDNAKVPKGTVGIIRSERSSDRWLVEFMGKPYGINKSECELWHAKGVTSDGAGPEAPPAYINVGGWRAGLMRQSSKMQCVQANPVAEP